MPLSSSPLLPGTSPLPAPGQRPPDRRALRLGALAAVPVLVLAMTLGSLVLPRLLFLAPMFQAQAGTGNSGAQGALFQGFVYPWTRNLSGGGYNTTTSLQNMRNEARTFHMNAVIIPVFADMPHRDDTPLEWHASDPDNTQTLPDSEYVQAIQDARRAGLLPILELEVRQFDPLSDTNGTLNNSAYWVGKGWLDQSFSTGFVAYTTANGTSVSITVGPTEHTFFDQYTQFAVYYAQLSAKYNLPYFIIGDGLASITYDTASTVKSADPQETAGFPKGCTGRRDCEWRHVIAAIRGASYTPIAGGAAQPGGSYGGKLIYSASWTFVPDLSTLNRPPNEFEAISWWDALDLIGVDAHFPLTQHADVSVDALSAAWRGQGPALAGQGDIYSRLQVVAQKFNKPLVFTSAGYESISGSNGAPAEVPISSSSNEDDSEQAQDMEALLATFNGTPWWQGVFWYDDQPMPYANQPNWHYSTAWANSTPQTSKLGGQFLSGYYHNAPLACQC